MNRTVRLAAAALALAAAGAGPGAAEDRPVAGVVVDLKGSPKLARKGKDGKPGKEEKLKLNNFVYEGDVIKTGAGDMAALAFVGGAEVRINENSEFVMESGGGAAGASSVYTKVGQAWTRLLHGKAGMKVRSPIAVAAVRGTEADVDVAERMEVKVYEGLVDLSNDSGRQTLGAGMMAFVAGAGVAPSRPRQMGQGDYGTWHNGLTPQKLDKNLRRLKDQAEKTRTLRLRYKKDGKPEDLNLRLEKK